MTNLSKHLNERLKQGENMRRKLNELTRDELSTLYDANSYLQGVVLDMRSDDENYYAQNEICSYFEHYNNDLNRTIYTAYFDTNYDRVTVTAQNREYGGYFDFLDDCKDYFTNGIGAGLNNASDILKLIDRLLKVSDKYDDAITGFSDLSDENENRLMHFFDSNIEKLENIIAGELNAVYDSIYDNDYNKSFFIDGVYEFGYFDDMTTDGRNVFFEVCKA